MVEEEGMHFQTKISHLCFPDQIFHYDHPRASVLHEDFSSRVDWHGTEDPDVQIGAIYVHNITFNDTGTYRCTFERTLFLPQADQRVTVEKDVELTVVTVGKGALTWQRATFVFLFCFFLIYLSVSTLSFLSHPVFFPVFVCSSESALYSNTDLKGGYYAFPYSLSYILHSIV